MHLEMESLTILFSNEQEMLLHSDLSILFPRGLKQSFTASFLFALHLLQISSSFIQTCTFSL